MVLLPALIATRALLNRFRDVPAAAAKHAKTGSKTVPNYRQFASLQRYEHAQRYKERGSFSTASTTVNGKKVPPHLLGEEEWEPIYRFNQISKIGALSRFKIAQTAVAVLLVPLTAVSLSNGFISTESMLAVTGAATFACLMLYAISYWVMRIVGVISVNRSRDFIRVGHLSFWGGRRNRFFLVDDVTPLSELSIAKSDLYTKLKSIESDEVMLLPLVGVAMPDRELFEVVFGKFDFTFNRNAIVDRFKKFQ